MLRLNTDNAQYKGTFTDIVRAARIPTSAEPDQAAAATSDAAKRAADPKVNAQQPSPEQLKAAVDAVNEAIKTRNAQIRFEIDDKTSQIITRIVDTSSGELIRQIPSEEVLRIARAMADKPTGTTTVPLVRTSA